MEERIVMTKKNYEDLQKELDYLVKVKRPEIRQRVGEAKGHGDLSENAEYHAARDEYSAIEGKIEEIELKLKNADIRETSTNTSYIDLGSVVTVFDEDLGEEEVYTITTVADADVMTNKISIVSPAGSALLNKKVGDKVAVKCPDGSTYYLTVKAIGVAR